jgi:hypothetical protein
VALTESKTHKRPSPLNIPIGRVELFGQVLSIVEHEGRLVAACPDESGMRYEVLSVEKTDAASCHHLMRRSLDLLFETAQLSLALNALANQRNKLKADRLAKCRTTASARRRRGCSTPALGRGATSHDGTPQRAFPTDTAMPCALSPVPSAEP